MAGPADAPRDLLFGLLALQNGMISRDQLVAAFGAWTGSRNRVMAEVLAQQGALAPQEKALLEALVEMHLKRYGGDPQKSLASLEVGRSTRESLARLASPQIDATLSHVGSDSGPTDRGDPDRTPSYAIGTATSDGQRFRVLRPHAQGGLGAVFVALDGELNREVALKQILDSHADDPTSRARFLIEAEITGGLEHPGIVPVYGLGTYGDGRPYYAMRFINGDSLKQAIERFHADAPSREDPGRRSLELRDLLRRFTDICNAIGYAHSRGVLHRDIKPGNVIVGKYGETLVVDWGLAKATGRHEAGSVGGERTLVPSSASGSAETLAGSALGTPAYMSPEQAGGDLDRLGPRSDVYSLGATLYCLLTGRPPFAGEVGDVLRAVHRGEFPTPRKRDSSIDPALEAVCLKAMANRPDDRYPTTRALAADLERWAADEPVSAWREPFSRRARRWGRRNRTAVTAATAALLAGVVGLVAVLAVQTRAKAEVALALANETRANRELAESNGELGRSRAAVQARYDLAVYAIETFHTGVSEDFLLKQDQFKDLRDRLLISASDFYGRLGALLGRESDPASRRALAQANYEVAELTGKVGRTEDALAAHRRVLAAREALASDSGTDDEAAVELARSRTSIGALLESAGKTDEALASYREAERRLSASSGATPSSASRTASSACRSQLGWLLYRTGHTPEALAMIRLARADQEALAGAAGAKDGVRRDLATTLNRIGALLSETGMKSEAEVEHRGALAILRKLAYDNPTVTDFHSRLANTHIELADLLSDTGRATEAEAEYRAALAVFRKLSDDNPAVTEFRSSLANNYNNLGILSSAKGKPAEAEAEYRRALEIRRRLVEDNPTVSGFRSRLAMSHNNLGILLYTQGRATEAEAEYRAALALFRKLADDNPDITRYRNQLASGHSNLGILLSIMGKPSESEVEFRASVTILRKLADDNPTVTDFAFRLADSHNNLGILLLSWNKPSEAETEHRAALAIFRKLADDQPKVTTFRLRLAQCHRSLGVLLASTDMLWDAEAEYRRALAIFRKLADESPGDADILSFLAQCRNSLGIMLLATGRATESEAECREALALFQNLGRDLPAIPAHRNNEAEAYTNIGAAIASLGRAAEARGICDRAVAIRESLVKDHPTNMTYRRLLTFSLRRRGLARREVGDPAGAEADARRALAVSDELPSRSGEDWFEAACCHAVLSGLVNRDGSRASVGDREVEAGKAMELLHRAAEIGYRKPSAYRTDPALSSLRDRDDFRVLLMDLAMPSEVFAPGE